MKLTTAGFYATAIGIVLLDQAVKLWTQAAIPVGGTIPLFPGVFVLSHTQNRGMAFSLLEGKQAFLVLAAVVVAIVIMVAQQRIGKRMPLLLGLSLALPLGGALGNLIDRVWHGYVTDLFYFQLINFPVFNVADSAITVGMALLFWHTLVTREPDDKREEDRESENVTESGEGTTSSPLS